MGNLFILQAIQCSHAFTGYFTFVAGPHPAHRSIQHHISSPVYLVVRKLLNTSHVFMTECSKFCMCSFIPLITAALMMEAQTVSKTPDCNAILTDCLRRLHYISQL